MHAQGLYTTHLVCQLVIQQWISKTVVSDIESEIIFVQFFVCLFVVVFFLFLLFDNMQFDYGDTPYHHVVIT